METTVTNATEYRNVSLSLLSESKTNPRRMFEDAALKELSESIRTQAFSRRCLFAPLPRMASRSSQEHDGIGQHRWPRLIRCPYASST
jgi:hypothetical protein